MRTPNRLQTSYMIVGQCNRCRRDSWLCRWSVLSLLVEFLTPYRMVEGAIELAVVLLCCVQFRVIVAVYLLRQP